VDLVTLSVVQRLLAKKGQQHLAFIRTLVADIGHNVIVPNIFFKAYLRRLGGKIERLSEIQEQLKQLAQAPPQDLPAGMRNLAAEMAYANEGLQEEFDHIRKHYVNTSLFLETLLRQSHFEKGRYVLQKKTCNFNSDIIGPQVEQYLAKLKAKGIEIDISMGGVPDQVIEAVVDIGLISQVFANLLSNAVKYTRPAPNDPTNRKFIAYGLDLVHDAFGPGEEGVKINLFSSGKSLDQADVEDIFQEGRRGSNIESERGTGHGLFFVKEVVELHGGITGYEATPMGNNFYFILPR
jgi:signal transduction histidine kinase